MEEILYGINNYWESQPELVNAFPGGIWLVDAPPKTNIEYPYVAVNGHDDPFYTYGQDSLDKLSEYTFLFFIHCDGDNGMKLIRLRDLVAAHFDNTLFEVDGWDVKMFKRERSQELQRVEEYWQTTLEYSCIAEKCI